MLRLVKHRTQSFHSDCETRPPSDPRPGEIRLQTPQKFLDTGITVYSAPLLCQAPSTLSGIPPWKLLTLKENTHRRYVVRKTLPRSTVPQHRVLGSYSTDRTRTCDECQWMRPTNPLCHRIMMRTKALIMKAVRQKRTTIYKITTIQAGVALTI